MVFGDGTGDVELRPRGQGPGYERYASTRASEDLYPLLIQKVTWPDRGTW